MIFNKLYSIVILNNFMFKTIGTPIANTHPQTT